MLINAFSKFCSNNSANRGCNVILLDTLVQGVDSRNFQQYLHQKIKGNMLLFALQIGLHVVMSDSLCCVGISGHVWAWHWLYCGSQQEPWQWYTALAHWAQVKGYFHFFFCSVPCQLIAPVHFSFQGVESSKGRALRMFSWGLLKTETLKIDIGSHIMLNLWCF